MVLRLGQKLIIENLRQYSTETVEKLRQMLASGAQARPDPHRKDFFELESDSEIFYICVSPLNGKVWLLGTWPKNATPVAVGSAR